MDHGKRILKWIRSKIIQVKNKAIQQQENAIDVHGMRKKSGQSPLIFTNDHLSDPSESSNAFNDGKIDSEVPVEQSGSFLLSMLEKILPGSKLNNFYQTTGELNTGPLHEEEQLEYSHQNKLKTTLNDCAHINLPPISEGYKKYLVFENSYSEYKMVKDMSTK